MARAGVVVVVTATTATVVGVFVVVEVQGYVPESHARGLYVELDDEAPVRTNHSGLSQW